MHIAINRICVPTDFSPSADHAIQYGAALAEMHDAELHLLHVLHDFEESVLHLDFTFTGAHARAYFNRLEREAVKPPGDPPDQLRMDSEEEVHAFLRSLETGLSQRFAKLPLQKFWDRVRILQAIRYGNAAEEICRYARRHGVDLLVVGTHGRTGFQRFLMGSVAERVVRVAPCPVLTVRHPEHEFVVED